MVNGLGFWVVLSSLVSITLNTQRWVVQVRIHTACVTIPTSDMDFAITRTASVEQLWRAP
jgi:hypothetical protein